VTFLFAVNSSLNIENVLVISFLEGYNFNTHTMGYFIAEKMQNLLSYKFCGYYLFRLVGFISSGKYLGPSGKTFLISFFTTSTLSYSRAEMGMIWEIP